MKKLLLMMILSIVSFTYVNANEQLDSTLAIAIQKGIALAETTGEFVIEQTPDLVQEFYTWHLYKHIFWLSLWVIILSLCIWMLTYAIKEDIDGMGIFSIVMGITSIVGVFVNIFDLIYLLVSPKLYLIEYLLDKTY